ncbi:MAG: hypothetical protein GC184_13585 [Rhizobiales bacterium]|nr:hypothetical protein [Hyphomicrobiales bacterium]
MRLRILSAAFLALAWPGSAQAATLARPEPVATGACEMTCSKRQPDMSWTSRRDCFEKMNSTQCDALADHRNKNDAYPQRYKCEAKIIESCEVPY